MKKLASQIVNYIAASAELTSRLQEKLASAEATKKAAAEKATFVLQSLLDSGCVRPESKQAASKLLASHDTTLDFLANAATKIAELKEKLSQSASELGSPDFSATSVKSASETGSSTQSGGTYLGRRFRREKSAADIAFLSILKPPKTA